MRFALVVTLTALVSIAACSAQEGFVDSFDGPKLNERWEWFTPKAGPRFSLTDSPGHLRVTMPQVKDGFNHWVGERGGDAPLLLAPAPEGDFSLETHLKLVSFEPSSNFHLALTVGFSKRYLLAWGPFFGPLLGNPKDKPEIWCEPTGQAHFLVERGDPSDVYLRIEKTGRRYAMSLRRNPDAPWKEIGFWRSAWPAKYVGFMGKTFGDGPAVVADIDYVKLEPRGESPAKPASATIAVDCAGRTWPLDPMRFGHFIEHLGNCIDRGIWAEMLFNRKFTGATGDEGVVEGWQPLLTGDQLRYMRDNAAFYCPSQSQRIEIEEEGKLGGVRQDKIILRGGIGYRVRLVAKQQGLKGPVRVGLVKGKQPISQVEVAGIGADWTVREVELEGPETRTEASFVIAAEGPGTLWLGAVSLMPADNVDGMRADVLAAIREIKPPVIRWPGGNFVSQHDWRDAIGERDKRPPRWNRAWNIWEWSDFGTDEFLRFCELVGTTPYICVNCGEGSASEAAAWVEYCNGPVDSTWGKVREVNRKAVGATGRSPVPIWGIGNEMYGDWQHGHLSATNYGLKAVEFAQAMRAVDPSIRLIGVGVEGDGSGHWNREVCRIAGAHFDWLAVHYYLGLPDGDEVLSYATAIGAPAHVERMLSRSYDIAREASGKELPIAFDEWNIWRHAGKYTLREGLFDCCIFNALNRLGEKVTMANLALLVNVLGAIQVNATDVVRTPTHQAFDLYVNNSGALGLAAKADGATMNLPHAGKVSALDVCASLSEDKETLYLAVVNRLPEESVTAKLELRGFEAGDTVRVTTLNAEAIEAANTFRKPDEVRLEAKTVSLREALGYTFPAHSATVMVFGEG